jgi:hypothetical protein
MMSTNTLNGTATRIDRFKKVTHETVEAVREKGAEWRLVIDGPIEGLTPAQARILANELTEAADSAGYMNKPEVAPSLAGRELLLLEHGVGDRRNVFADGLPKRVIRMTHSNGDRERLIAISAEWCKPGKENHTLKQGKNRSVTYQLVGYFELILEGSDTDRHSLVGRVAAP